MIDRYLRISVQAKEILDEERGQFRYSGRYKGIRVTILSQEELALNRNYDCVATNFFENDSPRTVKPFNQINHHDKRTLTSLHNGKYSVEDIDGGNPKDRLGRPLRREFWETTKNKPEVKILQPIKLVAYRGFLALDPETKEFGGYVSDGRFKVQGGFSWMMDDFEGLSMDFEYAHTAVNIGGERITFVKPSEQAIKRLQDKKRPHYEQRFSELVEICSEKLHRFDLKGMELYQDSLSQLSIEAEQKYNFRIDGGNFVPLRDIRRLLEVLTYFDENFVQVYRHQSSLDEVLGERSPDSLDSIPLGFINWKILNQLASNQKLRDTEPVASYLRAIWSIINKISEITPNFDPRPNMDIYFNSAHEYFIERNNPIFLNLPAAISQSGVDLEEMVLQRDDALSALASVNGSDFGLTINIGYHLLISNTDWLMGQGWLDFIDRWYL